MAFSHIIEEDFELYFIPYPGHDSDVTQDRIGLSRLGNDPACSRNSSHRRVARTVGKLNHPHIVTVCAFRKSKRFS